MMVQAEISLYPLRTSRLSGPINRFCDTLVQHGLRVETGRISTTVSGELHDVFEGIESAMADAAESSEVVLLVRVSNGCPVDTTGARD